MSELKKPIFIIDDGDDGDTGVYTRLKPLFSNNMPPKVVMEWELYKKLSSIKMS